MDWLFRKGVLLVALSIVGLTLLLAWELFLHSRLPIEKFGWSFLWKTTWDPVGEVFGALPFLYGTLVTSFLALLIAVPVGLGMAIFLSELVSPWVANPISLLVELLAAIPSVIYGLIGIFVLVPLMRNSGEPFLKQMLGFLPFFQGTPYGVGMLTAGILLAIMILPFIISVSREILLSVPNTQREAILSLGATRWEMIRIAVIPYARSGIFGSVFLALARALGETMAVTMVIGNRPDIKLSLFEPSYSMTAIIANEFSEATSDLYIQSLIEIGLILFGVTILIHALARILVYRVTSKVEGRT
ncbi:MAG: phosphate ABC transporter permease subunit PstC [Nitrospirae bacterium]|nr:phosphate ABC transporter permease subunit PstC [Nitrospirota bacterium]MBI3352212.1 phosphate ABC transporter permease subunit PstC [Nitrospirota bacterium]